MDGEKFSVTTKSGFEVEICVNNLNDFELLDYLNEVDSGNMIYLPKVVKKVLNAEDVKRLYDHCRQNGRVPYELIIQEIQEILSADTKSKNPNPCKDGSAV